MAKREVDMELKMAFAAQQQKLIETKQKLRLSDIQIEGLKKSIYRSNLVDREIASLPDSTRTYESVGRMFVLKAMPDIRQNLNKQVKTCEEKIKTLEGNKSYLERSLKDSENNLREMVQQRKDALNLD